MKVLTEAVEGASYAMAFAGSIERKSAACTGIDTHKEKPKLSNTKLGFNRNEMNFNCESKYFMKMLSDD